ncbi:MAG: dTDP-glucose 4,6-dehydratase [Gammaproteobacteria bacterium]
MIVITGGAGFIGSNFVHHWLAERDEPLVVFDALTYAGNLENLAPVASDTRFSFVRGDITDREAVERLLNRVRPRAIVHFAAESHVDRSIRGPQAFLKTNVEGTFVLLEAVRVYRAQWAPSDRESFRFLHVSTDEVYGSLGPSDPPFSEATPFAPNSPYAASKAASDLWVRAYTHTYGLPTLICHCSNNYGPYQFPEKLIPLMIHHAIENRPLPLYGDGSQVRDWLHVEDHCRALLAILDRGRVGETYNIGGRNELTNREVVETVCRLLDRHRPRAHGSHVEGIAEVPDRPGHDWRYAIDTGKIERELGWVPRETFVSGIEKTLSWYLDHPDWVWNVTTGAYREWLDLHYGTGRSERPAQA